MVSSAVNKGGGNAPFALFLVHALLRKTLHRHTHSLCVVGGLACIMGRCGSGRVDGAFGGRKARVPCRVYFLFPPSQAECLELSSFFSLADLLPLGGQDRIKGNS